MDDFGQAVTTVGEDSMVSVWGDCDSERAWLLVTGNAIDRVVSYRADGTKEAPLPVARATNIAAGSTKVFVGHPRETIRSIDKASRQLAETPYRDALLLTSDGAFLYWITSENALLMAPQ